VWRLNRTLACQRATCDKARVAWRGGSKTAQPAASKRIRAVVAGDGAGRTLSGENEKCLKDAVAACTAAALYVKAAAARANAGVVHVEKAHAHVSEVIARPNKRTKGQPQVRLRGYQA
jgi:hypothetical protein